MPGQNTTAPATFRSSGKSNQEKCGLSGVPSQSATDSTSFAERGSGMTHQHRCCAALESRRRGEGSRESEMADVIITCQPIPLVHPSALHARNPTRGRYSPTGYVCALESSCPGPTQVPPGSDPSTAETWSLGLRRVCRSPKSTADPNFLRRNRRFLQHPLPRPDRIVACLFRRWETPNSRGHSGSVRRRYTG
jgi:hypothetical protein